MGRRVESEDKNLPVPYDDAEYVEAEPIDRPEPEPELVGIEVTFTLHVPSTSMRIEFYDEENDWVGSRPLGRKKSD